MIIRRGTAADAPGLAALARETFFDTFASTNNAGDMAIHLERAYGVAQQAAELIDPAVTTWLVDEDGSTVAYAQVRTGLAAEIFDRDPRIDFSEKSHDLCFRESLLHRPTLSLGRTLNRNATQKWGDVTPVAPPRWADFQIHPEPIGQLLGFRAWLGVSNGGVCERHVGATL